MTDLDTKPVVDLKKLFIPVIFANGEDNDLPGLLAAVTNERVMYDDKVYEPNDSIAILGGTLVLDSNVAVWTEHPFGILLVKGTPGDRIATPQRPFRIDGCRLVARPF